MFRAGKIAPNYAEAIKWYHKAADQGHAEAQTSLGHMFCRGQGVTVDCGEAMKWYRKAADQGYVNAQYCLGHMLRVGEGIAPDYAEAMKWYRKAADQGDAKAQFNLGLMYELGDGLQHDYVQARKWYMIASSNFASSAEARAKAMKRQELLIGKTAPAKVAETQNWAEHNRLYVAATNLLDEDRVLVLPLPASLDEVAQSRVRKAIALLERVMDLDSENWAALWVMGKAYQGLGEHELALDCFTRARFLQGDQPQVAREAGISAMECGRADVAIEFTSAALALSPDDAGLRANLGLAYLFAGQPECARQLIDSALKEKPDDEITRGISSIVDDVLTGKRPCPRSRSDI